MLRKARNDGDTSKWKWVFFLDGWMKQGILALNVGAVNWFKGKNMRIINAIHVIYAGFFSGLGLVLSLLGGIIPSFAFLFNSALALVGLLAVIFYFLKSRIFGWLLLFWWIPQFFQIIIVRTPPTYPARTMTPVYSISIGLRLVVFLRYDLGPDEYRLVQINVLAIIGLVLAIISIMKYKKAGNLVVADEGRCHFPVRQHAALLHRPYHRDTAVRADPERFREPVTVGGGTGGG